jgi:hypothetical protein
LVEDAVFCHRCGRPLREAVAAPEAAPDAPPPPPPLPAIPTAVNFHNSVAVRIAFLVASIASMLDALPALNLLFLIWSACAGFVSVVLYRRSTGQTLSVRGGAKMGWITGVLNSVIMIVLFTVTFAMSSAEFTASMRQQIHTLAPSDPTAASFLDNPVSLATVILFSLLMVFVVFTGACMAGGALGARITRDDRQPR